MFKNKKTTVNILTITGIILVIAGFIIPYIEVKIIDAILLIILIVFLRLIYIQHKDYSFLFKKYTEQKVIISDIFKYCPDLIFLKDTNFRYIDCNKAFIDFNEFGKKENVIGLTDKDLLEQETARLIKENDEFVLKSQKQFKYIQRIRTLSNKPIVAEIVKAPFFINGELKGLMGIGRDVTQRELLRMEVMQKQSLLVAFFENLPYIAFIKNIDNNIIFGNRELKRILNIDENNMDPISLENYLPEAQLEQCRKEDNQITFDKKAIIKDLTLDLAGKKFHGEIHKAPVLNGRGKVTDFVVIVRDITIYKENEKQKETFIATLTHDLKTPVSAQIRALQLTLDGHFGDITKEQKVILKQTMNSCKFMKNMISTILTTYKQEDGRYILQYEPFEVMDIVNNSITELAYLIEEREQKVIVENNLTQNFIEGDKIELKRVITNLISNAVSYTTSRTKITIRLSNDEEDFKFTVHNDSLYINKEELQGLFEKYISNATKFRQIGNGLGLYLSKEIIKKHSGQMIAISEKGKGNTFGFIIPLKKPALLSKSNVEKN
ncbi:MAG: PAS domain-containing sensor histidine kinase [Candidatus Gastranaerophilales bacterium]|nr:PAS domain-containing sensor histidine kinase [Candidatus Gastranaerophilales bacterium]